MRFPQAKAPVTLRLVFHDAGTFSAAAGNGGSNASIAFELERPENFGLKRGWRLIETLEKEIKGTFNSFLLLSCAFSRC